MKEDRNGEEAEFKADVDEDGDNDFKPVDLASPESKPVKPLDPVTTQETKDGQDQPKFLKPPPVEAPDPINAGIPDRQKVLNRALHRHIESYVGFVNLPNQVLNCPCPLTPILLEFSL